LKRVVFVCSQNRLRSPKAEQETMADFDFTHPEAQAKINERFGNQLPQDERVVSPAAIFNAQELVTVHEN
jgi:hypothetical protein